MAIEKMSLVNVVGNKNELEDVLLKILDSGTFHLELPAKHLSDHSDDFALANEPNLYAAPLASVEDISIELGLSLKRAAFPTNKTIEDTTQTLAKWDDTIRKIKEEMTKVKEELFQLEMAEVQIQHLLSLNISFDDIFAQKHIKVRFGRLPVDSFPKLRYYENKPFFFFNFDNDASYYWGVYFSPIGAATATDSIFESLMFERIRVPDFVHGTPGESKERIIADITAHKKQLDFLQKQYSDLKQSISEELMPIYSYLNYMNKVIEIKKQVAIRNDAFYIAGYVPNRNLSEFSKHLDEFKSVACVSEPASISPKSSPPIKLRNSLFARPFQGFVEMYSLPSYRGIDPTFLVALSYSILFGIMFGDLGQGLLLSLIGAAMYKFKKMFLGKVLVRVGLFSAFFGLCYGSVFGYEHALNPIYSALFGMSEKPIEVFNVETTNYLLLGAIGLGSALIIIAICINIVLGIRYRDPERAIFSPNGLTGLALYVSVVGAGVLLMIFNVNIINPVFIIGCIVIPILLMFFREPLSAILKKKKFKKKDGFILENFFEMFEFLLSYLTNTISFLRVGGFILSHAGMMAVVMTLSNMVGGAANPFVVIFGNLFVMALEGLIVGIQVLRLQFYEIFSRFYDGEGSPFTPVTVVFKDDKV